MTNALAVQEQREQHPLVVGIQQRMATPAFATMLPAGMDVDRFAAVTIQAIVKNPDLLSCTPESVIAAVIEAAQDGLEPTGARGGAHLVKFGSEAVLIRDYRGIIRIIIESGAAERVDARVVRQGDEFALDYASPDPVVHRPALDGNTARGYYALFWLPNGTKQAEFMTVDEIEQVRAKSRGRDSMGWTEFFDQMARKTVIKRGANYLNLRPDIRERLLREDEAEFEGQVISVQRDERLAQSRSKIHDRAARLTGGATEQPAGAVTTPGASSDESGDVRGAPAGAACPHPQERHQATAAGIECGACGELIAQRAHPPAPHAGQGGAEARAASPDSHAAPETVSSDPATPAAASSPPGGAPSAAPTTLDDATVRVGNLAIARGLVRADHPDFWTEFDRVIGAAGVERPPLETNAQAVAEWNALGDRIEVGEFAAVADDPAGQCAVHGKPWKHVEAGERGTPGTEGHKKWNAFWACPDRDCKNKPTKAWRDSQKAGG